MVVQETFLILYKADSTITNSLQSKNSIGLIIFHFSELYSILPIKLVQKVPVYCALHTKELQILLQLISKS
jgi:hypothetical protein